MGNGDRRHFYFPPLFRAGCAPENSNLLGGLIYQPYCLTFLLLRAAHLEAAADLDFPAPPNLAENRRVYSPIGGYHEQQN